MKTISKPDKKEYTSPVDGRQDWYMVQPPSAGSTWLVNLHGHGAHGDQIFTRPDIRDGWLPEINKLGLGIIAPNLRDNAWMCPEAVSDLHYLLNIIRRDYDAEKFILLSGSMGGTGSLIYTIRHPEDITAVAALCPVTDIKEFHKNITRQNLPDPNPLQVAITASYGGTPDDIPDRYESHRVLKHYRELTMPVYLSHGTADLAIPVDHSRKLYRVMSEAGMNVTYDEIPDGNHDAPLHDGRVWTWLRSTLNTLER